MQDNKQDKKDTKKLTLTVRSVETLETRASPNTACPDNLNKCCHGTKEMYAAKLTAVAFF